MTIKKISLRKEFLNQDNLRLDPYYYILSNVIKLMSSMEGVVNKTIKEAGIKVSSGSYVRDYKNEEDGIVYLRVGNVKPYSVNKSKRDFVYAPKNTPERNRVFKNEIILGRTQASTDKFGVASIIDEKNSGFFISQHVSKINTSESKISPEYLVSYLNSNFYVQQLKLASQGDTRVELTHSQLRDLKIFLLEDHLVKKIEENTKNIIYLNRKSISLLDECRKILTDKIGFSIEKSSKYFSNRKNSLIEYDLWNPKCNQPNLKNFQKSLSENFRTVSLSNKELFSVMRGKEAGSKNYKSGLDKEDSDIAFIRTSDVINNEIDLYPDYFVSKQFKNSINYAQEGDILFSRDGLIGETALITKNDKAIIASGFYIIRLIGNNILTPEYIFLCLSSNELGYCAAERSTVFAATIPHLQKGLSNFIIPVFEKYFIDKITKMVAESFNLKRKKKDLILENRKILDDSFINYFSKFSEL